MKKFFVLDAVNFLFRSYYAIAPMTNTRGESTHALFGFIRSVLKIITDFSPDYIVAVFDGPDNKKSRQELYKEYKSHRKSMPEDLFPQLEKAMLFCKLAGIPTLCVPGVEADDTIGSIIEWTNTLDMHNFICTSDKDLCQLVSDSVFVVHAHKDNLVVDRAKVIELFSVLPKQIVDYLALIGDASDNIPGVDGIGPKTASALLTEFHSLQNILDQVDTLTGKKKELLIQGKENALLSRQLALLDTSIPIPKDLAFYQIHPSPSQELHDFYLDNHFLSLLKSVPKQETVLSHSKTITQDYTLIHSEEELKDLLSLLQKQSSLCIDTETTALAPMEAFLVGVGLGYEPGQAWYIPLNGSLPRSTVLAFLSSLFLTKTLSFYGHNIKYDLHVFLNERLPLPKLDFDTMLASYLLTPHILKHNLDALSLDRFGYTKIPIEDLIGKGKKQTSMLDVPLPLIQNYCCEDVDYTIRLKTLFLQELKAKNLLFILETIELPLLIVLLSMERKGLFLDLPQIRKLSHELSIKINSLEGTIHEMAGEPFNINSPKQLSTILFEKLQLPRLQKTKTGFSTSAETLEALLGKNPIIQEIISYRQLEKLRSTYADALQEQINPKTGRIHCTFNQSVAATGRLSCQSPNLQNIPVRSEEGKKIRAAFRPEYKDWSYLSSDYSQIELRLLAHLSEDPALLQAFHSGEDIHAYTASLLCNTSLDKVSPLMRHRAKAVNFGILYGQQAFGLSQELGIPYKEAEEFIHLYFQRYPKVKEYLEHCKELALCSGVATTMTGRQRPIPDMQSKNPALRSAAERLAINTPLQGTAADLIKLAMIQIHQDWSFQNSFLILQIHDELLFEVHNEEISTLSAFVKKRMEGVFSLKVPLVVDISVGKNWGDC